MTRTLLLALALGLAVGCSANWRSIGRPFSVRPDNAQSLAIDAKQRVVYSRIFNDDRSIVCAEPSPDALTALSSALAGSVDASGYGSATASYSAAEAAMNIGVRTQTIQLLRDGMYRLCEAYFNSALEGRDMRAAHLRYQDLMVALLAIEQLTGAATPRPAVTLANASGEAALRLNDVQDEIEEAEDKRDEKKKEVANLEKKVEEKKAAEKKDGLSDEDKAAAKEAREAAEADLKKAKEALAELEENVAALEERRDERRSSASTSATTGSAVSSVSAAQMTPDLAREISGSVKAIAVEFLRGGREAECLALINARVPSRPSLNDEASPEELKAFKSDLADFESLRRAREAALSRCTDEVLR